MTQGNRVRRYYGIAFGAYSAVVGILFIVQVWSIYALGNKSFTVENISNAFSRIAFFVWLWVAAFVGVVALAFISSQDTPVERRVELRESLVRLSKRLPKDGVTADMQKQRKFRLIVRCVCGGVCLVCGSFALSYLVGEHTPIAKDGFFASHIEAERLLLSLPWVVVALGGGIAAAYLNASSYKTEIALVKTTVAENAKAGVKPTVEKEKTTFLSSKGLLLGVRIAVGVLAVVCIVLGINNGGMADVFAKAVKICTQCIGLG